MKQCMSCMGAAMLAIVTTLMPGCGRPAGPKGATAADEADKPTPEEQRYLDAARPFAEAVAARQYDKAYAQLAPQARARMSLNQFAPEDDNAKFDRNEKSPLTGVSAAKFAELMKLVAARHGQPRAVRSLYVFSMDPDVLNRRAKDNLNKLDSMFAIGAMPDAVAAGTRRASVRGQILTELSAAQLAETAKAEGISVADLQADKEFAPYFNFKVVLVEEAGARLSVGYFEFLPPSMMD